MFDKLQKGCNKSEKYNILSKKFKWSKMVIIKQISSMMLENLMIDAKTYFYSLTQVVITVFQSLTGKQRRWLDKIFNWRILRL